MKLILVRHGQTNENIKGILLGQNPGKLSKEGIESAKKLSKALANKSIDHLISSDLKRCVDTALILVSENGWSLTLDKRLREINFGEYQGKPYGVISGDFSNNLDAKFPSGESNRQLIKRVVDCINEILSTHSNNTILLVSHSGPISAILAAYHGTEFNEALIIYKLGNSEFTEIELDSPLEYAI